MKPKILVLDDDRVFLQMISHMLMPMELAWNLELYSDPSEALKDVKKHADNERLDCTYQEQYSVALVDYYMPSTNGIDFLKQLSLVSWETVSVLITSKPSTEVIEQAINTAIYMHILKSLLKKNS